MSKFVVRQADFEEIKKACSHDKRLWLSPTAVNYALDVDDKPVAYISYIVMRNKVLRITLAYTFSEYRSKGYGSKLLSYTEKMMREKYPKLTKIETCALLDSVKFYARLGLKVVKFKSYKVADCAIMERIYS